MNGRCTGGRVTITSSFTTRPAGLPTDICGAHDHAELARAHTSSVRRGADYAQGARWAQSGA